jgi:D-amino-acid dehydrogenase
MRILVLGAGVVGVTSAWYLARDGHEVTVVDRQPAPGLETSFANGGQISVSHSEPWANPSAPLKILKWLGREDAPLLFRLRADPCQWAWGLRFLAECLPSRTRENTLTILRLALYSLAELKALRRDTGIAYDHLERGILQIHGDQQALEDAHARVELMRSHGFDMRIKTPAECFEIEPALRTSSVPIAGGTFAPEDESGDANRFTVNLAALAASEGVRFRYEHAIEALSVAGTTVDGAAVRDSQGQREILHADRVLVALGSYSRFLLSQVGIHLSVYPVKGYSVTIPLTRPDKAPVVCLSDESAKIAITRLGDRLRAAGTAELADYDTSLNEARCQAILDRVRAHFPEAGDFAGASRWAGLRPTTPSNVPYIGPTRLSNLFVNTGHGTLGWTLACGSGRALADLVAGRPPALRFPFLRP